MFDVSNPDGGTVATLIQEIAQIDDSEEISVALIMGGEASVSRRATAQFPSVLNTFAAAIVWNVRISIGIVLNAESRYAGHVLCSTLEC